MSVYTAAIAGDLDYRSPTVNLTTTGTNMSECSGIGVSRLYNQTVWCHDDSGDTGRIFSFNTANGLIRRTFNLLNPSGGANWPNSDFEELSLLQQSSGGDLIFVYDTIGSATTAARLYRVIEPNPTTGAATQNVNAARVNISFPSGVYSEANFVDPLDGRLIVFYTSTNTDITVWRSASSVITAASDSTVTMSEIANLGEFAPIPPVISGHTCEWLGSADIAPDRSCIILHPTSGNSPHYDRILIYQIADPFTTSIADALATTPVLGSDDGTGRDVVTEVQGEATAFLPQSNGYMRIGEGANRPIHIVDDNTPDPPPPVPITSVMPDGRTFDYGGPCQWSHGNDQYAIWVRRNSGLTVGKRSRSGTTWTTHTFTGANATTLGLPVDEDDHNMPAIAVDGLGRLIVIANMHTANPVRYLETVNTDGNIAGPWQRPFTNLPGAAVISGWTYPSFSRFSDGTLLLLLRNSSGSADDADTEMWRRGPTATAWTYLGKILKGHNFSPVYEGETDAGPYFDTPYVDEQDRIHVSWIWRLTTVISGGTAEVVFPSYMYSDDQGSTWKSIAGTAVTLPVQINTQTATRLHPTDPYWPHGDPDFMVNGGAVTAETGTQRPWFNFSRGGGGTAPTMFHWDGAAWQWELQIPAGSVGVQGARPVWHRNAMWLLGVASSTSRAVMIEYDTGDAVYFGGDLPRGNPNPTWTDGGGNFFGTARFNPDPVALAEYGAIELLIPEGDTPKMFTVGANALTRT